MKSLVFFLSCCVLLGIVLGAGCTSPPPSLTPTPTPTTIPPTTIIPSTTPIPTTTAPSLTPGPTVTVPEGFETNIGITVDDVNRIIFVTYNGGKSQILLQRIDARVITATGRVITRSVTNEAGQIPVGYTFDIKGDRGVNRIEVTVTINAVSYKVTDTTVQFR